LKILEAYCVELGRVIDIFEAQKAFFSLPEVGRKRFEFRCSDDACRAEKNPLVSGINYHRLAEEDEKFRQMHFREEHPHTGNCVWMLDEAEHQRQQPDGDGEHTPRLSRAKETDVIDVFRPKQSDTPIHPPGQASTPSSGPTVDGTPPERDNDTEKKRAREGYSSTTHLERFINCWSQLEGDALKRHEVVIEGQTLTYRQAVTLPKWLAPEQNGRRIVYGLVTISLWPAEQPTRIYLNFRDQCDKFDEHLGSRTLTIDLPLSRLNKHSGGALLKKKLAQAQTPEHHLRVFGWGEVKPRGNRPGYTLDIASLDNLVLKPVLKKPKPEPEGS
jgi:hypothetical protein